ncbi:MAG TPA: cation diffusion facilitator family transporter [Thermoanaerobaculia bacterium]|nr:cation diffusion facilitator family transporter [Thermoanaerobaculia bacterium]
MHQHRSVSEKLTFASIATLAFVVAELIAGTMSGSLSLVGDALHNFTDTLALFIALVAVRLERRPATDEKSFGYQRAGILAAFINAGALVAFTAFIAVEAVNRFRHPQNVNTLTMLITAAVALLLNATITFALRDEGRHDVNIRSAVLHMLGDAISSAGIIVAAILIRVTSSSRWDPAVSLFIAALILWSSWGILRETVNLLLEGVPAGIDPAEVTQSLGSIEGVYGVHHLHIWALGPSRPALSCHLMVGDVPISSTSALLDQVTEMLHHDYRIVHATVQFEFAECADDDPYCIPLSGGRSQVADRRE